MTAHQNTKRKKDPYKTFVGITIAFAVIAVISFAVFLVCNMLVDTEYNAAVDRIYQQNVADEQAFNLEMSALRENAVQTSVAPDTVVPDLASWEATLDGTAWSIKDEGSAGLENTQTVTINSSTLCEGGLMLVNNWHSLPEYFSTLDLVGIGTASGWSIPVQDQTVQIFPDAYNALKAMYDAATAEGMKDYIVWEGYRTNEYQTELFTSRMDALSTKYSGTILVEKVKETIAYPGTSEYQTGLSVRIGLYNKDDPAVKDQPLQNTPQGDWLENNSWKYGYIFRFPSKDFPNSQWEDKSYKTGFTLALNIYRYVGKPHAVAMKIMGFCLEEYVEFLMKYPHITIYENGVLRYEIVRINVKQQTAYDLPITSISSEYTASIDNMGGVVMAYTYGF
jgi:zinc D-Ala-D-Ala carboxypeptidase